MTDLYDLGDGKMRALHGLIDCTNDQYQNGPGISKSQLDAIAISPLAYWDMYLNPEREPREYKHAFAVGDGTHKLILEPGEFQKHYDVGFDKAKHPGALNTIDDLKQALMERNEMVTGSKPELVRRLLEIDPDVQILLELERRHNLTLAGKTLMPASDYKNMLRMLYAVTHHDHAGGLLYNAKVEQSFYVTDRFGNLRKCRTDAITANGQFVVDLKTTEDVSLLGFGRTIWQRRYMVQAAWYLDILRMLYGSDAPKGWAFVAAQKTRPFDVAVHYLTEDQIEFGRRLYKRDLALLWNCRRTNVWPGADGGELLEAKLPTSAQYQDDAIDLSLYHIMAEVA